MPESFLLQATVLKRQPFAIGGDGAILDIEDTDKGITFEVIDGCTGAAVGALGHCDPDIVKEIAEAGKESVYSFPSTLTNRNAEELAQFICENSPKGAFKAAIFTCSGSESNDNALKIIRQYHVEKNDEKRTVFISRAGSYHGYTIGSMSISGSRTHPFEPILIPDNLRPKASNIYRYRDMKEGETEEQYKDRLLLELEDKFKEAGPENVAAFITETVTGSTIGTETPLPGYLEGCRDICHKYGALFMLDEVMCGMGRCGTLHAWEQFLPYADGLEGFVGPDLQSIGKTLGSGYVTIAGVLISPKVRDTIVQGSGVIPGAQTYHSHSFNCRISLAVQKKVAEKGYIANILEVGNYLGAQLKERVLPASKFAADVRGVGGFWSVEFVKDHKTKAFFNKEEDFGHAVSVLCLEKGLAVMGYSSHSGEVGDRVTFAPSFIITKEDVDKMVDILIEALAEAESKFP